MAAHDIFQAANAQEAGLIPPDHAEINVWLNGTNCTGCSVINAVTLGPFNKGNDAETQEDQVVTKDECEFLGIVPLKIKLLSTTGGFAKILGRTEGCLLYTSDAADE